MDEQTVVYPSGSNVVLYNHENKTQKFIHLTEKAGGMSSITVSTNKKWLAVAELGKKPSIVIHELSSLRKRKVLNAPEMESSV